MSRKQYEQIQNALNQMGSLDRQAAEGHEKHANSIEDKSFENNTNNQTKTTAGSQSNKQYPQIQNMNSSSQNFNQIIVPSTSSKRSHKITNGQNLGSSSNPRRKTHSQNQKQTNFAVRNQYITQQQSQQQAQNDLVQLMKKREKMNNSALDRIGGGETLNGSKKF